MQKSALVFLAFVGGVVLAQQPTNATNEVSSTSQSPALSLDSVLASLGAPACARRCVEPLARESGSIFSLEDVVGNYRNLCKCVFPVLFFPFCRLQVAGFSAYDAATTCNTRATARGCWVNSPLRKVYDIVTSGVKSTCVDQRNFWDNAAPCLEANNTMDKVIASCNAKCDISGNITSIAALFTATDAGSSIGKQLLSTVEHLGPVSLGDETLQLQMCDSLLCFLPCARDGLNAVCQLSGTATLQTLLAPFEKASDLISDSAPIFQV